MNSNSLGSIRTSPAPDPSMVEGSSVKSFQVWGSEGSVEVVLTSVVASLGTSMIKSAETWALTAFFGT